MKLLEERIRRDGVVLPGDVLKIDSFLNQQMDVELFALMAKEFARLFEGSGVNKVLTVEASGIGIACITALELGCKAIYAKKHPSHNRSKDAYSAPVHSYTHGTDYNMTVSKEFLSPGDNILLVDDFLATGSALVALAGIVREAGANVVGAGIVVEKAYQGGHEKMNELGIRVESLARVKSMNAETGAIEFCE